jgi:hypothetical protein
MHQPRARPVMADGHVGPMMGSFLHPCPRVSAAAPLPTLQCGPPKRVRTNKRPPRGVSVNGHLSQRSSSGGMGIRALSDAPFCDMWAPDA